MEMKRLLKGFIRLMFALIVTCGVGFFALGVNAKADAKITVESDGDGGLKYQVKSGDGDVGDIKSGSIKIKIGTLEIGTGDDIATAGTPVTVNKTKILEMVATTKNGTKEGVPAGDLTVTATANDGKTVTYDESAKGKSNDIFYIASGTATGTTVAVTKTDMAEVKNNVAYGYKGDTVTLTPTLTKVILRSWTSSSSYSPTPVSGVISVTIDDASGKQSAVFTPVVIPEFDNRIYTIDPDPSTTKVVAGSSTGTSYKIIPKDTDGNPITTGYKVKWTEVGSSGWSKQEGSATISGDTITLKTFDAGTAKYNVMLCYADDSSDAWTSAVPITFTAEAEPDTYTVSFSPDPSDEKIPAKTGTETSEKQYKLRLYKNDSLVTSDSEVSITWSLPSSTVLDFSTGPDYFDKDVLVASAKSSSTGYADVSYTVKKGTKTIVTGTKTIYVVDPSQTVTAGITTDMSSYSKDDKIKVTTSVTPTTTEFSDLKIIYSFGSQQTDILTITAADTKMASPKEWTTRNITELMEAAKKKISGTDAYGTYYVRVSLTPKGTTTPVTKETSFEVKPPVSVVTVKKVTVNPTYVTAGQSTYIYATFTTEEKMTSADKTYMEENATLVLSESDDSDLDVDDYFDQDDTPVVVCGSKSGTIRLKVKNKKTSSEKFVAYATVDGVEGKGAVAIVTTPALTTDYKSDNHTIKFTLPAYVGTINSPNMAVTGYRLNIYQSGSLKKSLDVVTTSDKAIELNVESKLSDILNALSPSGDSCTFNIGIQPAGANGVFGLKDDSAKSPIEVKTGDITAYKVTVTAGADVTVNPTAVWGLPGQKVNLTASTSKAGADSSNIAWTKSGSNTALSKGATYSATVSTTTADNKLSAVLSTSNGGDANANGAGGSGGSGGNTTGLDDVPKTAESNAPIWLIIVLVFAAIGGGYALYMMMRPVVAEGDSSKNNVFKFDDDDYDDNF